MPGFKFQYYFSKIKWFTDFEPSAYCFGEIADYEYQLPAGWKIGSNPSTGSNWIQGTNSVTITSDLSTGNGARIFIRPKNTCGTNLNNYQVPASIVVLRAAAALTISASPNTVACGSTSPVVFTIDNTSSLTGITGYMWELGNNNNWTYNGSPAPSSIYTTTNTLTLSPVCGTSLVSPSASVVLTNAGNTCNIPVPAPTLTVTAPSLSIQGTQSLCSGTENYLIVGAPCNSPAIWSIEPGTGIANLNSTNGVSTSLTKVSDGKIVLTAKVASCATEYPVTLPIQVGTYTSSDFTLTASSGSNGYLSWCPNTTYGFTLGGPASNYSWYYPTGWTPNYISGYICAIRSPSTSYPPTGDVSCTFTEPCGTTISKTIFVAYSSSGCSPITEPAYTYWPNPVTYSISVSVSSANMGLITIRAIEIVNASNYMTVFSQNYGTGVTNTSVTTYYYQPGNYLLRVYDGTTWRTYQFVKM
ncbi:MAG: hypothetical protein IPH18_14185 [Chitinophagaceae bacterium]|nr:hypothetical protein [Chitinophagaceae bacterium]